MYFGLRPTLRAMSSFRPIAGRFVRRYALPLRESVATLLAFPVFKAAWMVADPHASRLGRSSARIVLRTVAKRRLRYTLTRNGRSVRIDVPLTSEGIVGFSEVFFSGEYGSVVAAYDTVVDLGANLGLATTYLWLETGAGRIVAVEANPNLIADLTSRLAGIPGAAVVHAAVVGDSEVSEIALDIGVDSRQSAIVGGRAASADTVIVPTVTLSELVQQYGVHASACLKMDIEGAEHDVIGLDPGALTAFDAIVAEVHGLPDRRDTFAERLGECGFSVAAQRTSEASTVIVATRNGRHAGVATPPR